MEMFRAGGRTYTHKEIIAAAELRGELSALREELGAGLAAAACAAAECLEMEGLQVAVNAYRKEQGLITADDTAAFFAARDLTVEDLCSHLERRFFAADLEDRQQEIATAHPLAAADVEAALWGDLVFGGSLARFASALAERVAVKVADRGHIRLTDEERAGELQGFAEANGVDPQALAGMLAGHGFDSDAAVFIDELAEIEGVYQRSLSGLLTPARQREAIVAQRLALMQVEFDVGYFTNLDAAREAYLCVSQDGDELDEVLQLAKAEGETVTAFLDDLPEELNKALLSGREGETLAPIEWSASFVLCKLRRKVEPALEEPAVAERIDTLLLDAQLAALVSDHVTWIDSGARGA